MRQKKRQVPEAYRSTPVPAGQSRQQIEDLLMRAGAEGVVWQVGRTTTTGQMQLRFSYRKRVYRFSIPLFAPDAQTDRDRAQDERQRMRALLWSLKAMIEQDQFGLIRFEDAAVAWAELALPAGGTTTVGEVIHQQIERCAMPNLDAAMRALPARSPKREDPGRQ